ncbi:hypothetical protein [Lysinibacillus sp. G4S2]|uniref:hypothetical protein n=1 Tax=Lysinibacillus sp. G4S2 TaxID=3055859 RepID=UPI00259FFB63|nr:hypothetical protein [Lysinibacillus sp. G4S2]MDM5250089.1 hypothetical protein [Lysinibacillus sp. G4S2]
MAQINRNKKHNSNRMKMSVPIMRYSVSNDNERVIAIIEAHQRRQVKLRGALVLLYVGILFFLLMCGVLGEK